MHDFLLRNLVLGEDLCFLFSGIDGILLHPFPEGPKLNNKKKKSASRWKSKRVKSVKFLSL